MNCEARSPIHGNPCRLDGLHPDHLAGYADQRETWPNKAYVAAPPRAATSNAAMAEVARLLRPQ